MVMATGTVAPDENAAVAVPQPTGELPLESVALILTVSWPLPLTSVTLPDNGPTGSARQVDVGVEHHSACLTTAPLSKTSRESLSAFVGTLNWPLSVTSMAASCC